MLDQVSKGEEKEVKRMAQNTTSVCMLVLVLLMGGGGVKGGTYL